MTPRRVYRLPRRISDEEIGSWCSRHEEVMLLQSNRDRSLPSDEFGRYDRLLAVGAVERMEVDEDVFSGLDRFHALQNDWVFGHLSYELKDQTHPGLSSQLPDGIGFPISHFFRPRYLVFLHREDTEIHYLPDWDTEEELTTLLDSLGHGDWRYTKSPVASSLQPVVSHSNYVEHAEAFLRHIQRGDIYEANYCMEFSAKNIEVDPFSVFLSLNHNSPMPFAAYYQLKHRYLMCASPERFLAKRGDELLSQPIKGTIRRGITPEEDEALIRLIQTDTKEQAENIMITDLVRNDLSVTAQRDSVRVKAQCEVKTYPRIHQLVTSITSRLRPDKSIGDVLRSTFPMGSMTGAPKRKAMEIIESLESSRRGLYSGSVGYLTPEGDFDFNVVIRSIQYNSSSGYLSLMAGSALTAEALPEKEYDECMLKASTMFSALS